MLRPSLAMLTAATLAAGLTAQIPDGFLLIGVEEWPTADESAIRIVDPATGVDTPVFARDASDTRERALGVCMDPLYASRLYTFGSTGGFLGPNVAPLLFPEENNVHPDPLDWGPAGFPGFTFPQKCVRVGANLLATNVSGASNNGLWMIDLLAQTATGAIVIPVSSMTTNGFAEHVAAIGDNVYLITEQSNAGANPSAIYEWNTLLSTSTVINPGTTQALTAAAAFGGTLYVGDDLGDIYSVDLGTGALTPFFNTGLGLPIAAIASKGGIGDPVYFATREIDAMTTLVVDKVYDTANLATPIYTFNSPSQFTGISQLWVGTDTQAVQMAFGRGCDSTLGTELHHQFVNKPTLGNAGFRIAVTGGPSSSPGAIHFGFSRTMSSGGPLPIDLGFIGMPGCSLYTEPFSVVPITTDAMGNASVGVPIPADLSVTGARLYTQWPVLDIGANLLNVIASDGAEFIVK